MNEKKSLYRFSPIDNKQGMLDAVEYVTKEATKMVFRDKGYTLPIKYVTIFAHYEKEYSELVELAAQLGTQSDTNNGIKTALDKPIEIFAMKLDVNGEHQDVIHSIESIRIRKPDPYRTQVGCCDFEYDGDYTWLASTETLSSNTTRRIQRDDIDMVEFFNPDFDVLGYVVKK